MTMLPPERIAYWRIATGPPLKLPNGARMAVWVIVNVEEWDAKQTMPRTVLTPPAGGSPTPDIPNWAWHEYGNRVGFWRILKVFDEFNIPGVLAINGSALAAYPPIVEAAMARNWEFQGQDYTFGHEQCGGLGQVFTEGGGEIVQQFWHPLNTADFSPYLGQLADLKIDAVFAMETGADATRFIQQYSSFGLKAKTPLLAAMNGTDQSVIRTLGEECEGIISPAHFAEGSDNPVTQKFVKEYEAKFGKIPSLYGFSMYSGVMWIDAALKKVGGKVEDREAL